MKTKILVTSITIYVCAVVSLTLVLSGSELFAFPLIVVMNVLGYNLVKSKYERNPKLNISSNTNDTWMLYLCKLGGCYCIASILSFIYLSNKSEVYSSEVKGTTILLLIIMFNITPNVKDGVKRIQEKYVYSQK